MRKQKNPRSPGGRRGSLAMLVALPASLRLVIITQFAFNVGFYLVVPFIAAHLAKDLLLAEWIVGLLLELTVVVLLFVFDWRLGVACLIPLVAAFATMGYLMNPRMNNFQKMYLDAQERMSSEAVEYVRGIPVVKVFQQTVFSFKRFYDSIITYRDLVTKYTLSWQKPYSFYTKIGRAHV